MVLKGDFLVGKEIESLRKSVNLSPRLSLNALLQHNDTALKNIFDEIICELRETEKLFLHQNPSNMMEKIVNEMSGI